ATATIKKVNDIQLRALINGKNVVVSEDVIRRDLHLDDADGVECLQNEDIFVELCLSAKRTAWNEFSCSISSAIICHATGACIQTGGKIEAIDADEDITLVDVEKDKEVVTMDAEPQGRVDQEDVNAACNGVNAVEPTIFDDEEVTMTMDQTLIKMKAKKAKLLDEQIAQKLHDEENRYKKGILTISESIKVSKRNQSL
nr:hypothetical protein [Tanacetum cinerariifolium]